MSVAGPTIAGTGADGGGVNVAWVNPGNITANDGSFATAALNASFSNELKATNFNFAIPAGATIISVQVDIFRQRV
jgi:hypothetical protein